MRQLLFAALVFWCEATFGQSVPLSFDNQARSVSVSTLAQALLGPPVQDSKTQTIVSPQPGVLFDSSVTISSAYQTFASSNAAATQRSIIEPQDGIVTLAGSTSTNAQQDRSRAFSTADANSLVSAIVRPTNFTQPFLLVVHLEVHQNLTFNTASATAEFSLTGGSLNLILAT